MTTKANLEQVGRLLVRRHKAEEIARRLQEQLREKGFRTWTERGTSSDGKPYIAIEIALVDYLGLWPDAQPAEHTWPVWVEIDGQVPTKDLSKEDRYMSWPRQWIGCLEGYHFFVEARTKTVRVEKAGAEVAGKAVAA